MSARKMAPRAQDASISIDVGPSVLDPVFPTSRPTVITVESYRGVVDKRATSKLERHLLEITIMEESSLSLSVHKRALLCDPAHMERRREMIKGRGPQMYPGRHSSSH